MVRSIPTRSCERTIAAEISASHVRFVVYGTVLPWKTDPGCGPTPSRNWTEHYRAIVEQSAEWVELGNSNPSATLVVAGDFNTQLVGSQYYGTAHGQALLRDALARAGLICLTDSHQVPPGLVAYPLIDHICTSTDLSCRGLDAWEGAGMDGYHMSDHSGVIASLEL